MRVIAMGLFGDIFLIGSIIYVVVIIVRALEAGTNRFRKRHRLDDRDPFRGHQL